MMAARAETSHVVDVTVDGQCFTASIAQKSDLCERYILRVMIDVNRWTYMVAERGRPGTDAAVIVPPVDVDDARCKAVSILTDRRSLSQTELRDCLNYLATAVIALHGEK
jgi:hypothetical protein